ncbi:hypothetical protein BGX28_005371 [Mortierella sp. GBA30]|nr:hypothetical protein BGX28_005371 [Mortierella sp. GBA30]
MDTVTFAASSHHGWLYAEPDDCARGHDADDMHPSTSPLTPMVEFSGRPAMVNNNTTPKHIIFEEDIDTEVQEDVEISSTHSAGTQEQYYIQLEIHQQTKAGDSGTSETPRRFIFNRNTRLLLGRSPSCHSDEKARDRQFLEEEEGGLYHQNYGHAQPENGYDNGLFSNQVISKRHAVLYEGNGELVLEDLGSTHGTFLNGFSIDGACILHDQDQVRLGRNVVRKEVPYEALEFTVRIQKGVYTDTITNTSSSNNNNNRGRSSIREAYDALAAAISPATLAPEEDQEDQEGDSSASTMEIESECSVPVRELELEEDPFDWPLTQEELGEVLSESEEPVNLQAEVSTETEILAVLATETVTGNADQVESKSESNAIVTRKRKLSEDEVVYPESKRTALVAAALVGVVIGSVGTVFTLASF